MKNYPRIEFTTLFNRQRKDAPTDIKKAFLEVINLFMDDPENQFLRNHALKGKFAGYRSIDVTDDWRAVFREDHSGERKIIIFHMLGTHKELYG